MVDPEPIQDESIGGLLRGILMDVRTLIREEIALARVELRDHLGRARTAAISFGAAAAALAAGGMLLLIAVSLGIADLLDWPAWSGFLIVALLLSGLGVVMVMAGRKQLRGVSAVPTETVSTLKENSEWIAKRLSSARR